MPTILEIGPNLGRYFILLLLVLNHVQATKYVNLKRNVNLNCDYKQCECFESILKCKLDSDVKLATYQERGNTSLLDLSHNHLETVNFNKKFPFLKTLSLKCNKIKSISESQFQNLAGLQSLDLSVNEIESLNEMVFMDLQNLKRLNFSKAFAKGFVFDRQMCELVGLEILDISFVDIANFNLKCWKNIQGNLVEIHMKHTKNVESSWKNWFPHIGNKLKLLDLTDSGLVKVDTSMARKMPMLRFISLADNPGIDKNSVVELLKTMDFIERLEHLNISNINANSANLPLDSIIDHSNQINLTSLDISMNKYSDFDLNSFLFNQPKFKLLKSFRAVSNNFSGCQHQLISNDTTLLTNLEHIDISRNNLKDSSCLYSVKLCKSLHSIDMSHNKMRLFNADLIANDLVDMFAEMGNLSHVDMSYNQILELSLSLSPYHVNFKKLDLSYNNINKFRFLSLHAVRSADFPLNIKDDDEYNYDEYDDSGLEFSNTHDKSDPNYFDDDERFLIIEKLNLSNNHMRHINLQHMMQSVKNIGQLDFSHNPIENVVRLSGERSILTTKSVLIEEDEFTEILCIDELNLSHCKVKFLPNFEHTCINKISLAHNSLSNKQHLVISKFSTYFMDYLDLQWNNITDLKPIISNQKFRQDDYKIKNSPLNYYLGKAT